MANLNGHEMSFEQKQAELKKSAIVQAEILYHYRFIAKAIGITEDTLKNWRDEDKEFSEQLEQSRVQFIGKKMQVARPEFLLERLEPEIFKERKETDLLSDGKALKPLLVEFIDGPTDGNSTENTDS